MCYSHMRATFSAFPIFLDFVTLLTIREGHTQCNVTFLFRFIELLFPPPLFSSASRAQILMNKLFFPQAINQVS